ncbi:MAG: hypothetical protein AAB131_13345 [Actinomycetota bacterium]
MLSAFIDRRSVLATMQMAELSDFTALVLPAAQYFDLRLLPA